jgi:hypothetical protein
MQFWQQAPFSGSILRFYAAINGKKTMAASGKSEQSATKGFPIFPQQLPGIPVLEWPILPLLRDKPALNLPQNPVI